MHGGEVAFEKDYPNRKDWRRQYRDRARRCDRSCRSHGGCPHCTGTKLLAKRKADAAAREQMRDAFGA